MHYPLHITVLCTTLWILRGDVNAAKTGVSPEVLTSFAKNIASVLSSTLLGELRDSRENQTDLKQSGSLKKLLEIQSFHGDAIEAINAKFLGSTPDRSKRLATERHQSLDDSQRGFQNVYASDAPRYTKYYNPELYRFPVNRGPEIPRGEAIVAAVENANTDDRGNAIDGDVNAAALHYADDYHQQPRFKYKPDLVHHPLPYPPSQYGPHNFHDQYDNRPTPGPSDQPSAVAGIEDEEINGNPQSARVLDNRPYNLNYHDPYRNPHHSPFNNHEIYPHGPGNGQPSTPGDDQDAQNPSALTEDQNQKGGYIYPSFHYGPFHHGFYGPHYHNGPYNDSNGGNNSGPHHRDPYYGGYDPYFGPYHHPHYHNHNGRPNQGNENGQNAEQPEGENGNNHNNGNNHGNNHNYGYHDHGPFYGGHYGKYPGFPVFPYKPFGHGFYDPIGPKFKVPFIDPFGPFPLVPYFPPHGFYPGPYGPYGPNGQNGNNNNNDKSEGNAEKKQTETAAEAEAIAEGQSKIIESLSSNQQAFPFLFPVSIKNTKPDCEECSLTIG